MIAPQRQAAPRFAPEIPLSAAVVPLLKSRASSEPAVISKSSDLRLTHPNLTMRLPDPIPLKSSFLSAPAPESDFGRDRKKPPACCSGALYEWCFLGAHPPKQVLAPTGRNRFPCPPSATGVSPVRRMGDTLVAPAAWEPPHQNKFWPRREETAFQAYQRLAEAVSWEPAPAPKWAFGRDRESLPHFAQERFKNGFS